MRIRTWAGWVVTSLALVAGCDQSNGGAANSTGTAGGAKSTASATTAPTPTAEVTLQLRNFDQLQSLIASKKGKVVVVDVWSTNCPPCMEAFPGLVNLHKKYGAEKVACISLCADYSGVGKPEDSVEAPHKFLKQQGATFDNIFSTEGDETLYKKLKIASVPSIFVYDTEGKVAKLWETETPYATVEEVVKPLLK